MSPENKLFTSKTEAAQPVVLPGGLHPYTDEIFTITRKGHDRTTQSFGAPTLTWHVGIWQKFTPQSDVATGMQQKARDGVDDYNSDITTLQRHLNEIIRKLKNGRYPATNDGDDQFQLEPDPQKVKLRKNEIVHLKKESVNFTLWWSDSDKTPLEVNAPRIPPDASAVRVRVQIEVYPDFATITFFMDASKHWGTTADATDVVQGQRRNRIYHHVKRVKEICDGRINNRRVVEDALLQEEVFRAANDQASRQDLLEAGRYLYSDALSNDAKRDEAKEQGIWQDFCDTTGISLKDLAGERYEVFVNLRGLILSTPGSTTSPVPPKDTESKKLFQRFQLEDVKHSDSDEPNAVVRGYWPFVRRSRSEADHRDWIACGVLGWRAIFISSLGAQSQFSKGDEEELNELPHLPARLQAEDSEVSGKDLPAPMRYLVLTKDEPNRKQIGRMVDRIHSLNTLQLYAFKNWDVLRTANILIRTHGRQLDTALTKWVRDYNTKFNDHQKDIARTVVAQIAEFEACEKGDVEVPQGLLPPKSGSGKQTSAYTRQWFEDFEYAQRSLNNCLDDGVPTEEDVARSARWSGWFLNYMRALDDLREDIETREESEKKAARRSFRRTAKSSLLQKPVAPDDLVTLHLQSWKALRTLKSRRDEQLSLVNQQAERELIAISRALDDLGQRAVGGIQYRVNRSRYYAETYRKLLESMRCGNIETWWTYEQFANRSVDPVFRLIDGIGQRLEKLRDRLRSTMESVQTSAIVNQTEATRDNTYQMENIVRKLEQLSKTGVALLNKAYSTHRLAQICAVILGFLGFAATFIGVFLQPELSKFVEDCRAKVNLPSHGDTPNDQ